MVDHRALLALMGHRHPGLAEGVVSPGRRGLGRHRRDLGACRLRHRQEGQENLDSERQSYAETPHPLPEARRERPPGGKLAMST
jgi:hypothetical protein